MESLYEMEISERQPSLSGLLNEASSPPLLVIETDPQTDPRWEAFVESHPDSSIYHHPAWLAVLQREYKQPGAYFACEDSNGKLLAILPMLYTRGLPLGLGGPLSGRRLASLPRTPIAGPLFKDENAGAALIQAAVQKVANDPGIRIQIKTQGPSLDGMAEGLTASPWRSSYVLRLPSDGPFRIKDSHDRNSIKWAVNKATRLGVRVRAAESEADLRAWYSLYLEAMRRNMVPARPYRFFAAMWELLQTRGMMQLLVAEKHEAGQTTMIGGSVFLKYGGTMSYVFNGASSKDFSLRPNDMIQWEAINQACKQGFEFFDFGEVPEGNAALAKFKTKWGAEPTRLYRYYFPASLPRAAAKTDSESAVHNLAKAVWSRLPLELTAWLSDRAYTCL
jgi:CelD/BcsL family acetyltransferase involved in cellulose biosynthesis